MKHRAFCCAACALCLLWTDRPHQLGAQQTTPPEPIDAGVEDIGTLRTSERLMRHDLRRPASFDRVYQLRDGTQRYVRANGAVLAVFPRSTYAPDGSGATVPPGTVFYIGQPDRWSASIERNPSLAPTRRLAPTSRPRPDTPHSRPGSHHPTIGSDHHQPQPTMWADER